jgi:transcriptional regulator with XRE-family HTH domain
MDIANRLRDLRESKGLSQGDIERRSGLLRSYISRVEGGYTTPKLLTLQKFAKALGVEPYQLILEGAERHNGPKLSDTKNLSGPAKRLVKLYKSMSSTDRKLLMTMATKLANGERLLGNRDFFAGKSLTDLAREQGVGPVKDISVFAGGIPDDEDVDELLAELEAMRGS